MRLVQLKIALKFNNCLSQKEVTKKKLSAKDLRKLSREERSAVISKMSKESIPFYNKYKDELFVDETGDGIE